MLCTNCLKVSYIYIEFLVILGNKLKLISVKSCQKCSIDLISTVKKLNPWKIIKLMFAYVLIYSMRDNLKKCVSNYNLWQASLENFCEKQWKSG